MCVRFLLLLVYIELCGCVGGHTLERDVDIIKGHFMVNTDRRRPVNTIPGRIGTGQFRRLPVKINGDARRASKRHFVLYILDRMHSVCQCTECTE